MKLKIKKVGKTLDQRINKLKGASQHTIEAGWFQEQGTHSTAGVSYPELAMIHHNGLAVPIRRLFDVVEALHNPSTDPILSEVLTEWLNGIDEKTIVSLLNGIGQVQRANIKKTMGLPVAMLKPHEGNPNPLVDTGEWKSKTGFKTSQNKTIKTGGVI